MPMLRTSALVYNKLFNVFYMSFYWGFVYAVGFTSFVRFMGELC